MDISKSEIRLVQKCWFSVSNNAVAIADDFYDELFNRYPHYQQYFHTERKIQAKKLMNMINILINGLEVWENIEPEIVRLGQIHARIADFTDEDYQNVVNTFIWAMCRYKSGEDQATIDAWRNIFALISRTMLDASKVSK